MRHPASRSWSVVLIAFLVAVGAYLLALSLPEDKIMQVQKAFPRVSLFTQQIARARSFLPAFSPLTNTTPSTVYPQQHNNFSTTNKMTHDSMTLKDAVEHRRTIYQLQKKSPISDDKIKEVLTTAIKHVPSSFNSQSARMVALLKDEHDKFWDIVRDILKGVVPEDKWEYTANRISGFRNAYGTVLFYEDPAPVRELQQKYPMYADKFPQWSEHTSAMHQYMLWTAFEAEGFGCNLQHYNPLPDQKVAELYNVPLEWSLKAQLVFGAPAEGARENLPEKSFEPVEKRLFIHGA